MSKRSKKPSDQQLVIAEVIERRIFSIRGHRVMLDHDLARIYGVSTKRLNEQVKRNLDRFPEDFMFRLNMEEATVVFASRSQFATLKRGQNPKYAPYAFTEHGAVMAANVLNSPIAVRASIQVVRAFVRLREILATDRELARKLENLERKYAKHDGQIQAVFEIIKKLMAPPPKPTRRRIGFASREEE